MGKGYGVVLLAEALIERFSPREIAELQDVDRDAHGNVRVTEIDLGRKVKNEVQMRLEQRGVKVTIVDKTIGYELRCAPPIPIDAEYARDLGYAAVIHLHDGGPSALLTIQGGECRPIPFAEVLDQGSGKGLRRGRRHVDGELPGGAPVHGPPRARRLRGRGLGGASSRRPAGSTRPGSARTSPACTAELAPLVGSPETEKAGSAMLPAFPCTRRTPHARGVAAGREASRRSIRTSP